jgi:hypothetical protein
MTSGDTSITSCVMFVCSAHDVDLAKMLINGMIDPARKNRLGNV